MNGASGGWKLKQPRTARTHAQSYHLATMWPPIDAELLRLVVGPLAGVVILWLVLRAAGYRAIAWAAPIGLAFHWYSWLGYGRDAVFLMALGVFVCIVVGAWMGHTSRVAHDRAMQSRASVSLGTALIPRPQLGERNARASGLNVRHVPRALSEPPNGGDQIALERRPTGPEAERAEAIEPPAQWKRAVETTAPARVDAPVFDIHTRQRQDDRSTEVPASKSDDSLDGLDPLIGGVARGTDAASGANDSPGREKSELELAIDRYATDLQRDRIVRDLAEGRGSVELLRSASLRAPKAQGPGAARPSDLPGGGATARAHAIDRPSSDPAGDAEAARGLARTTRRGRWGSVLTDGLVLEFEGMAPTSATVLAVLCEVVDEDGLFDDPGSSSIGGWSRGLPLAVVLVPTSLEDVARTGSADGGSSGDRTVFTARGVFVPLIHLVGERGGVGRGLDIVRGSPARLGPT